MHAAYIRIDSSQDHLAHTLARLPDTRKSTSDFISLILARYDLKKKTFRMTVEPSYGREGDRFRMTAEPSYGRERVKDLGVKLSSDATFSGHIGEKVASVKTKIGWVLRTFRTWECQPMLALWKQLILCDLNCCSQLWNPSKTGDILALELLQRSSLHCINGMQGLKIIGSSWGSSNCAPWAVAGRGILPSISGAFLRAMFPILI